MAVGGNEEAGVTVYADPGTIRRTGNLAKMWQLSDYKTVQIVAGIGFLTAREQWEFDCAAMRSRMVALEEFSGNMGTGTEVYTNSEVGKWQPVEPKSVAQGLWKVACGKK